jgi:hypothetical protein
MSRVRLALDDLIGARQLAQEAVALRERLAAADAHRYGAGLSTSRELLTDIELRRQPAGHDWKPAGPGPIGGG